MGEGFVFIEIVIFAMIAAFLVYRLRSVLGRRTGEERPRSNPFTPQAQTRPDNVVPMPPRAQAEAPVASDEPVSLAEALRQIGAADPTFDEKSFLQGARGAFAMVVGAFANGDTAALRPLLSDEVYDNFVRAIRQRQTAGETLETRIERVRDADVIDARLDGRDALVTVKFVSEQVNLVRDAQGQITDGDPRQPVEVVDIWTFRRNTRARDPNWALVETRVPN